MSPVINTQLQLPPIPQLRFYQTVVDGSHNGVAVTELENWVSLLAEALA